MPGTRDGSTTSLAKHLEILMKQFSFELFYPKTTEEIWKL